jgi:hypothetical protein
MDKVDENLNYNLQRVMEIYENASHDELVAMLGGGDRGKCIGNSCNAAGYSDILQKQISALALDEIRNADEARIFVSNLVGTDGKVREAVSFRLVEFIEAAPELFAPHHEIFLKAIIDINGNVCRNVIQALHAMPPEFMARFCTGLIEMTLEILQNIYGKGYEFNKEVFKLYWCLEAIHEFCADVPVEVVIKASEISEYTIREKIAKILTRDFDNPELLKIKQELKNDPNYYVQRF